MTQLTDLEVASSIKEYTELKRKLEGVAIKGRRTDLQPKSQRDPGWTIEKTAQDLGISKGAAVKAIQIATAVEENPEEAELGGKEGCKVLGEGQ